MATKLATKPNCCKTQHTIGQLSKTSPFVVHIGERGNPATLTRAEVDMVFTCPDCGATLICKQITTLVTRAGIRMQSGAVCACGAGMVAKAGEPKVQP